MYCMPFETVFCVTSATFKAIFSTVCDKVIYVPSFGRPWLKKRFRRRAQKCTKELGKLVLHTNECMNTCSLTGL